MKQKLLTLYFCVALLFALGVSAPAQAETGQSAEIELGETEMVLSPIGESNLLKDGDFEAGKLEENWASKKFGTPGASLVSGADAFGGSGYSLKLTGGSGTASYPFAQQSVPLQSRAIYQLRMHVKKVGGTNYITTKLEFYGIKADGKTGSLRGTNTFSIKSTNGWEEVLFNFRAPFNVTSAQVMPRIESSSETAYFDDIDIYMVAPPEAMDIETDSVFYYPEDTVGEATVTVSKRIQPRAEGGYVAFTLFDTDGETPLVPETEMRPLDVKLSAAFSYDVGLLDEMKKEYRIRARVYDSDKKLLEEKTVPIYKFARPAFLGADGVYNDGKTVFTPVIAYDVPHSTASYRKLKEAGVTVVQGGYGNLSLADNEGLKVLVTLYPGMKPAGHPDNAAETKRIVDYYKNDERVFGWAIMDEPNLNLTDPYEDLRESYRMIRELDDKHPVFLNEASPGYFVQSAKMCDLLGTDPYLPGSTVNGTTVAKMNTTHVYDAVQKARAASGGKKPVACILQAFKWYTYLPDADAERHMIYQSLFAGASSHGYYKIRNVSGSLPLYDVTETDIWSGISTFGTKEQADAYAHFVRKEYKGFSHFKGRDILYHGYIKDNKLYMILLNQSITDTVTAEIPLVSFDGSMKIGDYTAKYVVGGSGSISGSGALSVSVPKHKAVVLEVKPKSGSLSAFSDTGFWDHVENIRQGCHGKIQNGNLETLVNAFPTEITATGAALETDKVHDGSYALKLTGSSTVSAKTSLEAGKCYDAAAYMKLTGGSIQLFVYNGSELIGQTEAFSEPMGSWQKMMVSLLPSAADAKVTIQITHTGDGEAYLDDIECVSAEGQIRNGDFEGKMNAHTPCGGWESAAAFGGAIQLLSDNGEQFIKMNGESGEISISTGVSLSEGNFYRLKLDAMGEGAAIGMEGIMNCTRIGAAPEGAKFWVRDFAYYFKAPKTGEFKLTLYCQEGKEAAFDAVSLESLRFGEADISETGETVSVKLNLPYAGKTQTVKLFLGTYDADGRLLGISCQQGTMAHIPFSNQSVCTEKKTGEVPALLSVSLPKETEHAVYKVFVWEGLRPVMTITEK